MNNLYGLAYFALACVIIVVSLLILHHNGIL
jgi:hypothetical protein